MFKAPAGSRSVVVAGMLGVTLALVLLGFAGLSWLSPGLGQVFLGVVALALGYGFAVEPYLVEWREVEVGIADLPQAWEGVRIAHLSDFHLGFFLSAGWFRGVIDRVLSGRPDLIVHTGDFFSGQTRGRPPGAEHLGRLQAPLGTLAVLGNHDHFAETSALIEALQEAGITLLRNRAVPLEREGARLWWVGVDDLSTGHDDLDEAGAGVPPGEVRVLLSHSPDLVEEASDRGYALMLSGHTHGGQVCLPGLGPVFCFSRFYKRYASGRFQVGPTALLVNRGLGLALLPFRFLCRPEVTWITLRRS